MPHTGAVYAHSSWVERLIEAARSGQPLQAASAITDVDPTPARSLSEDEIARLGYASTIPASAIREALVELSQSAVDPHGLVINTARVSGELDLDHVEIDFPFRMLRSVFGGRISAVEGRFRDFSVDNCKVVSVVLDRSQFEGSLSLSGIQADGRIQALGARVRDSFSLRGSTLNPGGGVAVGLDGVRVGGQMSLDGLTAVGEVRALSAQVDGNLYVDHAVLTMPGGIALGLDGVRIGGGVSLAGIAVSGEIRMIGARIADYVSMRDADVRNCDGFAITLDRVRADRGIDLSGINVGGQVDMSYAQVAGQVALRGSHLFSPQGVALCLDGVRVDGDVLLNDVSVVGGIRALGARVTGSCGLNGALVASSASPALDLERSQIGTLGFGDDAADRISGSTSLAHARLGLLSAGGVLPRPLIAMGWSLGDVAGVILDDWRTGRDWLLSSPNGFQSQPWHELAAVFDRAGRPTESRRLRFAAARLATRKAPWYAKPARLAYGMTVGYGYYPLIAALWLFGVFVGVLGIASAIPEQFGATGAVSVTSEAARDEVSRECKPESEVRSCPIDSAPERFSPVAYSLGVAVPAVASAQASHWQPVGAFLASVIAALRLFSWILTALLLAGVTGLLQRR